MAVEMLLITLIKQKLEIMKSWLLSMTYPIINWLEIEQKG